MTSLNAAKAVNLIRAAVELGALAILRAVCRCFGAWVGILAGLDCYVLRIRSDHLGLVRAGDEREKGGEYHEVFHPGMKAHFAE